MAMLGVGGGDHVDPVHDFIATFITDETLKERVLHVFSALPEDVQKEFMGDPAFVIGICDTGRSKGASVPPPMSWTPG